MTSARELELALWAELGTAARAPVALFILGSPRTGSTVVYQAVCFALGLPYIGNLTNETSAAAPIVGLAAQAALAGREPISFRSRYGKTEGRLQPSEGSAVMREWFGGAQPSQTASARFLEGRQAHCESTLAAAYALHGRPLAIKNAWNCFRVDALAALAGAPAFLWVRRDIADAAKSDLSSRYVTKQSPTEWNSATPANVAQLRKRPHWEQVVENQYEFNAAIGAALGRLPGGRWTEVWYERFLADPNGELRRIAAALGLGEPHARGLGPEALVAEATQRLGGEDAARIDAYVASQGGRFTGMRAS